MNTKIALFLFLFLILMNFLLFKNGIKRNYTLGVVIVLLINDLILNREHFTNTNQI